MPGTSGGHRTQSRSDERRDEKKQQRSASPDRGASNRAGAQELEERAASGSDDARVPAKPKREGRRQAETRTAQRAHGDPGSAQSRRSSEARKSGQLPEQENEEEDEDEA